MTRLLANAAAMLMVSATPVLAGNYTHNGSEMNVSITGSKVTITYAEPRAGLRRVGVGPGTVLFTGRLSKLDNGQPYAEGDARLFKRGCDPTPYYVYGILRVPYSFKLNGAAPVLAEDGCAIIDNVSEGPNAELRFGTLGQGILTPNPLSKKQPTPVIGTLCVVGVAETSSLNVRSGPGTDYGYVGQLDGHSCGIAGLKQCIDGWCAIIQPSTGTTGWVSQTYIARKP